MKIKSFEDIKAIDSELASYFLRPEKAVDWISAVEGGISEWIGKHNKQYWDVVRFVSKERGIVGRYEIDNKTIKLTRKDFAKILLKFCPNAFSKGETVNKLKSSMEHYQYNDQLRNIDKALDAHIVRTHIKDVENILDKKPVENQEEPTNPSLEDIFIQHLRKNIDENTEHFPCSKICIRPQYGKLNPAISVETYKTKKFLQDKMPSHIEVYEFLDGMMIEETIFELCGKYQGSKISKVFVVSSDGMTPDVRSLAIEKNIGFILIDSKNEVTEDSYKLPRSIEDYTKQRQNIEILTGERPMNTSILILNGYKITSSLEEVLSEHDVAIKQHSKLHVPYLSDEQIEEIAKSFTNTDYQECMDNVYNLGFINTDFSVDPFKYAKEKGLTNNFGELDECQLGIFDVNKNHVTLNSNSLENFNRCRFTMAHEFGHYILHAPLLKKYNVASVGETDETIFLSKNDKMHLEYQANKFASYLLMPRERIEILFYSFFQEFVHKRFGDSLQPIYYNPNQPETYYSYNKVVGNMAKALKVSLKAMEIRLVGMDLLRMS